MDNKIIKAFILAIIFLVLYYLLNIIFLNDINQIVNYIFLFVAFIIIFNMTNKLLKEGRRWSYLYLNDNIKEGNSYIKNQVNIYFNKYWNNIITTLIISFVFEQWFCTCEWNNDTYNYYYNS